MNIQDTVYMIQSIKDAGLWVKEMSCGWAIMRGETKIGEVYSLDGLQGWFSCWCAWVPKTVAAS